MTVYYVINLDFDQEDDYRDLSLLVPLTRLQINQFSVWNGRARELFPCTGGGYITVQCPAEILADTVNMDGVLLTKLFGDDADHGALQARWGDVCDLDADLVRRAHEAAWEDAEIPRYVLTWARFWGDGELDFYVTSDYGERAETGYVTIDYLEGGYMNIRGSDAAE